MEDFELVRFGKIGRDLARRINDDVVAVLYEASLGSIPGKILSWDRLRSRNLLCTMNSCHLDALPFAIPARTHADYPRAPSSRWCSRKNLNMRIDQTKKELVERVVFIELRMKRYADLVAKAHRYRRFIHTHQGLHPFASCHDLGCTNERCLLYTSPSPRD